MNLSKSVAINSVSEKLLEKDLFGIKYNINRKGVNISTFTPPLVLDNSNNGSKTISRHSSQGLKSFEVSLACPFFLPLHSSLNGLYDKCLNYLPELLSENESINIIWLFQKRQYWKELAISMYDSYLKGDDEPSEIELFRKVKDKMLSIVSRISSPLEGREYSQDVEDKILDNGYCFQCTVEIVSDKSIQLSNLIQDVFTQYDSHNGLRLEEIEYKYPYTMRSTNQILCKSEITSLLCQSELEIITDNPIKETAKSSIIAKTETHNNWKDRIELLPNIEKKKVEIDDTILPRLADALKRTNVIKQARLHNELIEHGSRLTIIHADIPKGKNFSDVEKKEKDIQAALGVPSLGIEQGDNAGTIKFSIPHNNYGLISLREIIERDDFHEYSQKHSLSFIVGLDEIGNPIYLSLEELRHILITGSQGSGKSVFVNQLLTTLLITHSPDELNLILIDPKQVELEQYKPFPHVQEVVTNMNKAIKTLGGLIKEMENRYKIFKENGVKNIQGNNIKSKESLPYIICVIEEWADLFSVVGKDAEESVLRLGQKARAAGIFLIIITQRPSAKILSGDIKANIQSKFSFNLGNNTNYRTVFDSGIPYKLLGKGDGAFQIENWHKDFQRFQSPIISTDPVGESSIYENLVKTYSDYNPSNGQIAEDENPLLDKLKNIIATTKETRVSALREKMNIQTEKLLILMNQLVDKGWLVKHKNRSKGYELVADESQLEEWR